ncbi:hypothetical protein DRN69_00845 [Candidatus Pacearchaeota archaeon]|nr:MAG: hypothetical protein DRN69_00845 [Candidatus Pacearchaeota archaeon]
MEQYTFEEFESFTKAMKKLSDILRSKNPDYIFAPLTGSVPLVDILSVIDRHFPSEYVEYPPNSSRFVAREEIMNKWYTNFLRDNYFGKEMSIVCVDEVISGSSAVKGYNEFCRVLYNFQNGNKKFKKKVKYEILGIGEKPKNERRNTSFNRLVNQKKVKVLETKKILTADNPRLNPVRLKVGGINSQGRQIYLPEIEYVSYSKEYLNLLGNIASYFGIDPERVNPINIVKMQKSLEKYLR